MAKADWFLNGDVGRIPLGVRKETSQQEYITGNVIHKIFKDDKGVWRIKCTLKEAVYEYTGLKTRVTCARCKANAKSGLPEASAA